MTRGTWLSLAIVWSLTAGCAHLGAGEAAPNLHFTILDAQTNAPISGKLVFLADGEPVDVGVPSGGLIASRSSTVYTADGTGSIRVPPGRYEIWSGRGLEYSADSTTAEIPATGSQKLTFRLRREVDTRGTVGGDLHLHTLTWSGHGDANPEERVISCLAEGLEWAVATDHNHNGDYAPISEALGLTGKMATTVGNEVSTPIGHFNAFPLEVDDEIDPSLSDAGALFRMIRDLRDPIVIQVNHPRWPGAAYFTEMDLHEQLAMTDNTNFSWDFDAFEILNENRGLGWIAEEDNPISVRQDWYNLLNAGHRFVGVGNSDSHTVMSMVAGVPRNYIASSTDDPAQIDEAELVRNLRAGRVSVNRGLYVEFSANDDDAMGDLAGLQEGAVTLHLRVQGASWIDSDTVKVIGNGEVVAVFPVPGAGRVERLRASLTLRPEQDTWYIVTAEGDTPMRPLVHDAPVPITPLGFSNPIWVDADGDGRFTSTHERLTRRLEEIGSDPAALARHLQTEPASMLLGLALAARSERIDRAALFGRLAPTATAEARLLMLRHLDGLSAEATVALLDDMEPHLTTPAERLSLALARLQRGDDSQWGVALGAARDVDDHRLRKAAFHAVEATLAVRDWRVLAPIPASVDAAAAPLLDAAGRVRFDAAYPGVDVAWRSLRGGEHGIVDLVEQVGEHDNSVAYAAASVTAEAAGEQLFLVGSDDTVRMWVNGRQVHDNPVYRGVGRGDDVVVATLRQGRNEILLRVENGGGGWGFVVEAADRLQQLRAEAR